MNQVIIEICAGSLQDCLCAWDMGIQRVELNSDLSAGGLTPSLGTLIQVKKRTGLKVICMVRPRPGGFCYDDTETEVMMEDARLLLENGADGIAFGFLNEDKSIDPTKTKAMSDLIQSFQKESVFHRAFDLSSDPFHDAHLLADLGITRILTSGAAPTAAQGAQTLAALQTALGGRIEILPGCGVNAANARQILNTTVCGQIHASCRSFFPDEAFEGSGVDFSAETGPNHGQKGAADPQKIKDLIQAVSQ